MAPTHLRLLKTLLAAGAAAALQPAHAVVSIEVVFDDPAALYGAYYGDIQRNLVAAGDDWLSHFSAPASNTVLTVSVGFVAINTANGGSVSSSFVRSQAGINIFEQGAAAELRTGIDPNGTAADISFNIGINGYLQTELWFDPTPANLNDDVVPANKTDARSVLLHEFGHALGFNGWRNGSTGALPGDYASTFDAYTALTSTPAGNLVVFTGPAAVALYGGAVPITAGNYTHLGNNLPLAGVDLIPDLMNGVVYYRGSRYTISALDLAILQDVGLPVTAVPEPAGAALLLAGLGVVAWAARVGKRRQAAAGACTGSA